MLTIQTQEGYIVTLKCIGTIEAQDAAYLSSTIESFIETGNPRIIVDLSNVGFVHINGLGALVQGHLSAAEKKGKLVLLKPNKQLLDKLAITHLAPVLEAFDDAEEAEERFL